MSRAGELLADTLGDGHLTAVDPDRCRRSTHADTLEWLAFRLVQLRCGFHVDGPTELVDHLRDLGARVTRALG